jgi:hypothetical protein
MLVITGFHQLASVAEEQITEKIDHPVSLHCVVARSTLSARRRARASSAAMSSGQP